MDRYTTNLSALNITGAGNLTLAGITNAAAIITATTATGNVTTAIAAGQTYKGGSGVDIVTAGAVLQTATVDGGAGSADKLVITDVTSVNGTGAAKFSNFEILSSNATTLDVSKFTNSTITGLEALVGAVVFNNVTATQAANVAVVGGTTDLTLDVIGATVPEQMDTVNLNTTGTVFTTLTLAGVENINVTLNKGSFTVADMTTVAAMEKFVVKGAGNLSLTTDALAINPNSSIDASALVSSATADKVVVDATDSTGNGLKIIGSKTLVNELTAADSLAAGKTSTLIGGDNNDTLIASSTNGSNSIIDGGQGNNTITAIGAAGTGTNTITAGDGHNTINTVHGTGASVDTVTVGNGYNTITTGLGADIITVGTGGNQITAGGGADTVILGTSAVGVVSIITQGVDDSIAATVTALAGTTVAVGDTITFGNGVDIIKGFNAANGDTLDVTNAGAATKLIGATAGTLDNAKNYYVSGSWDEATKMFEFAATGADTMLVVGDGTTTTLASNANAIVLVGVDATTITDATFI